MRISAGTMSPAASLTTSPTTTSSMSISRSPTPSRSTQVVVVIILSRFSAALPLRASCTKRSAPEMITIVAMMITVVGSASPGSAAMMSVNPDTRASTNRMAVNGLTNAWITRLGSEVFFPLVTMFAPYSSRIFSNRSALSPFGVLENAMYSSSGFACEANSNRSSSSVRRMSAARTFWAFGCIVVSNVWIMGHSSFARHVDTRTACESARIAYANHPVCVPNFFVLSRECLRCAAWRMI